jgi:uncharacterized protein YyaL (SSP411 family)
VAYSALTGSVAHRTAAEDALRHVADIATKQPRFFGWALAAAEALVDGPVQVAIVGEGAPAGGALAGGALAGGALTSAAWRLRPPGAVVVSGSPDAAGIPLLADRPLVRGGAAAYVCRGMVCDLPVTDVAGLAGALGR